MDALVSTQVWDVLWKISFQAALVAAVAWMISRLARKAPARVRHALWILVIVKFLVPPFAYLPSGLAFWQPEQATPARTTVVTLAAPITTNEAPDPVDGPKSAPAAAIAQGSEPVHSSPRSPALPDLLVTAWLTGIGLMVIGLLVRQARQELMVRTSHQADADMLEILRGCAERTGVASVPRLRVSNSVATPILIGCLRPIVVLPVWAKDSANAQHLEAMLLHELAHIRHRDMLWLWLYQLVKVPFFFHPGLWLAGYEMSREREFACDELVISSTGVTPQKYAAGYVEALKMSNAARSMPVCVAMAEPFEVEKTRVERILYRPVPRPRKGWVAALVVVAALSIPTFAGSVRPGGEGPGNQQLVIAGLTEMQGPGIVVTLRNKADLKPEDVTEPQYAVHDLDIRDFVNALLAAGAEAVSINGQRYVTTTAMRVLGPNVLINGVPLIAPFTIKAIGDPDNLERHLASKGGPVERLPEGMVSLRRESIITVERLSRLVRNEDDLAYLTGSTRVIGPGVTVTLQDSSRKIAKDDKLGPLGYIIHDVDLKDTINELKSAGALAIFVNRHRLVGTSYVSTAGPMIVVDGNTVTAPFVIKAVGDPEALARTLSMRGGLVERFPDKEMIRVTRQERLVIDPYTATRQFPHAKPAGRADTPSASQPKDYSGLAAVLDVTHRAATAITSGKGPIVVREWNITSSNNPKGPVFEYEQVFKVAFADDKYRITEDYTLLRNDYSGPSPNQPGYKGRRETLIEGNNITNFVPARTDSAGRQFPPARASIGTGASMPILQGDGFVTRMNRTARLRSITADTDFSGRQLPGNGIVDLTTLKFSARYYKMIPPRLVKMDYIGGSKCLMVEIVAKYLGKGTPDIVVRAWVDPNKGFTIPRLREYNRYGAKLALRAESDSIISRYRNGVWGPEKVVQNFYDRDKSGKSYKWATRTISYGRDFEFNVRITAQDWELVLPSGTRVYDEASNRYYALDHTVERK